MFQFRAFPSYTYFIQCMILEYCSSVLPHSDISGSQLICSSPKLFAACRVLHRLLMPRHSPCALISLTFVRTNCTPLRPPSANIRFISFVLPLQKQMPLFLVYKNDSYIFGSLELCRLNRSCFSKLYFTLFFKVFHNLLLLSAHFRVRPLLPCFLHLIILCSVFKVHT